MLLDSYTLKSGLSSLLPSPAPASFVKRVNASFAKIEALLKTIQVYPSPPEALVQAYLIHIADKNNANFRKILDMKGIRSRQEQNHLVELFQVHRASDRHAPNLQENSPILAAAGQGGSSSMVSSSTSGSIGLGSSSIGGSSSISSSRFDPTTLGSAIISAAKDGVDRFGNPNLSTTTGGPGTVSSSGALSPTGGGTPGSAPGQAGGSTDGGTSSSTTGNLNENLNLKSIGKFFRRDLGGFGGRFG